MSFFVIKPELKRLNLKNPLHLLAVGLGSGLCPKAPGTMGTLVAVMLYLLVSGLPTLWFIGLLVVGFVVGIRICQSATDAIGMPDHGAIVWDEVIGFGVTMIAAPAGWEWVIAGFLLFRLFDILKPWPICWFDRRIHGGLGIMLDDLIAGLFALGCMQWLAYWLR
ncbi:MAG: phosphatidylglycerophosphatase A family protein [Aeromonas sp.]